MKSKKTTYLIKGEQVKNEYIECKACGAKQTIKEDFTLKTLEQIGWVEIKNTGEMLCPNCSGQSWKLDRIFGN